MPPQPSQNAAAASRKVKFFQSYPHPCIKCVWHCRGMYVLHLLHRWLALLYICSPQWKIIILFGKRFGGRLFWDKKQHGFFIIWANQTKQNRWKLVCRQQKLDYMKRWWDFVSVYYFDTKQFPFVIYKGNNYHWALCHVVDCVRCTEVDKILSTYLFILMNLQRVKLSIFTKQYS